MKAVQIHPKTKQLFIGDWPTPTLGKEEILIRVQATALNRADLLQKRGLYPPPKGASPILGLEMSGVIEKIGDQVEGWKPGDRVCALLPGGGYAEKVTIPAAMAMPIPDQLSLEEAAAIPEVFLTAYLNLLVLGKLKRGEHLLLHAGGSGVGTAAIQIAREVGAHVIVTAGTEKKRKLCIELGAKQAIDYHAGPFVEQVKDFTRGKGVDLLIDFVGKPYWEQNLASLATDGRMILVGTLGGAKVREVNLTQLLMRRISIIGSSLRSLPTERKIELTQQWVEFAMPRLADGRIRPIIDSVWDLKQVNDAHEHMEQNRNCGKIVLRMNP